MNLIQSVDEHTCRGNRGYFESGKETRIEAEESVKYFTCYSVACYRYQTLIILLSISSVAAFALACCVLFSCSPRLSRHILIRDQNYRCLEATYLNRQSFSYG